jgi:gamma-glutamylcyclotransferase (GGCT)/AIG2-like uncharacterized protein YtfP
MTDTPIRLFSYGTLRQSEVQRALFGREVDSAPDALIGYALSTVLIGDPAVVETSGLEEHLIVSETGNPFDRVEGIVLSLTPADLAAADAYETADYTRVTVTLASGVRAFLYARA